jgi:hypothetical protein
MQMTVIVNGVTLVSKVNDATTAKEASSAVYDNVNNMNSLQFETEAGEFVVLGRDVVTKAILMFKD